MIGKRSSNLSSLLRSCFNYRDGIEESYVTVAGVLNSFTTNCSNVMA